jgi:hypothetical protein
VEAQAFSDEFEGAREEDPERPGALSQICIEGCCSWPLAWTRVADMRAKAVQKLRRSGSDRGRLPSASPYLSRIGADAGALTRCLMSTRSDGHRRRRRHIRKNAECWRQPKLQRIVFLRPPSLPGVAPKARADRIGWRCPVLPGLPGRDRGPSEEHTTPHAVLALPSASRSVSFATTVIKKFVCCRLARDVHQKKR